MVLVGHVFRKDESLYLIDFISLHKIENHRVPWLFSMINVQPIDGDDEYNCNHIARSTGNSIQ